MTYEELCRMEQSQLIKLIDEGKLVYAPCNVGDVFYETKVFPMCNCKSKMKTIVINTVKNIVITKNTIYFNDYNYAISEIGKTVFLTLEEAEKALKERENNGK